MKPEPLPGYVWLDTRMRRLHVWADHLEFREDPEDFPPPSPDGGFCPTLSEPGSARLDTHGKRTHVWGGSPGDPEHRGVVRGFLLEVPTAVSLLAAPGRPAGQGCP